MRDTVLVQGHTFGRGQGAKRPCQMPQHGYGNSAGDERREEDDLEQEAYEGSVSFPCHGATMPRRVFLRPIELTLASVRCGYVSDASMKRCDAFHQGSEGRFVQFPLPLFDECPYISFVLSFRPAPPSIRDASRMDREAIRAPYNSISCPRVRP